MAQSAWRSKDYDGFLIRVFGEFSLTLCAMRFAPCIEEFNHGLSLFSGVYTLYEGEKFRPDGSDVFPPSRI
jgi:hypothetical protein